MTVCTFRAKQITDTGIFCRAVIGFAGGHAGRGTTRLYRSASASARARQVSTRCSRSRARCVRRKVLAARNSALTPFTIHHDRQMDHDVENCRPSNQAKVTAIKKVAFSASRLVAPWGASQLEKFASYKKIQLQAGSRSHLAAFVPSSAREETLLSFEFFESIQRIKASWTHVFGRIAKRSQLAGDTPFPAEKPVITPAEIGRRESRDRCSSSRRYLRAAPTTFGGRPPKPL